MKKRGFTLVEIMIVVAIIALLAAIAIPNLLGARKAANDAAAKANLKTLGTELETYAAGTGAGAYPADIAAFKAMPSTPCTSSTGCGGFVYAAGTLGVGAYNITATPVSNQTGSATYIISTGGALTP
jgi:prepilin-type N-terminal cleavage/methylation domain-containing protein